MALADLIWTGWFGPNKYLDFYGIWSFARFGVLHPGTGIYDFLRLQAFQLELAPGFRGFYPCPYPPDFLAAIAWLGHLPIGPAKALWTLAGLAMLAGAGALLFKPPLRRVAVLALLVAPASVLNASIGETAFFATALLVAGFAWLPESPVLAGIAFGALTFKPQLGVLIPIALLARGEWRTIFTTGLTALALAGLSLLMSPLDMWRAWLVVLPRYQHLVLDNTAQLTHYMATLDAAAFDLHAPPGAAMVVQGVGSLGIAVVVWLSFRRADYRLAVAALLAGTALAAPHDYVYDTVFVVAAVLLAGEWMAAQGMRLSLLRLVLYLCLYLFPLEMSLNVAVCFIYILLEALVFISIARLALGGIRTGSTRSS